MFFLIGVYSAKFHVFCDRCLQREEELEVLRAEFEDVKLAFRQQLRSLMLTPADSCRGPP